MRLPWQPREYERICADCGYTWRVPHQFARRRVQSVSMFARPMYRGGLDPESLEHSELDAEVAASMEISKQAQAFKACPKCGSERYTQRRAHLLYTASPVPHPCQNGCAAAVPCGY